MSNALLLATYTTTREALRKALEIEATYKDLAPNWGQYKVCEVQVEDDTDPMKRIFEKLKEPLATGRQTCYCCGKAGHFKRD